jgi:hypothetical protein
MIVRETSAARYAVVCVFKSVAGRVMLLVHPVARTKPARHNPMANQT